MYLPAVRCKRFRRSGVSGLASMYPVSDWSSLCSGPLWISARMRSHYRTGLNGPFGSPVFACAGKTDPPSLLIPLADLGWKLLIALRHRLLLISPSSFVRPRAVPSSRPADVDRFAGRGGQGRPSRLACGWLRRCQAAPCRRRARREGQTGRTTPASSVLVSSKARPLASTAQAMRASLLASAIASTLWCNRLLAASIQDLSP